MTPYKIHISDVLTYKTCKRAWNWSSPLRGNLEPAKPYAPFFVGQGFHYAVEKLYREGVPLEDSARAFINYQAQTRTASGPVITDLPNGESSEENDLEDQSELILGMLQHYDVWRRGYKGPFNDAELDILPQYVEYEFEAPLFNPQGRKSNKVSLSGRVDGIALHKPTNTYWIVEYKTCRSLAERARLLPYDEQASAYLVALPQLLPFPIEGILYTLARKRLPTRPRVLQNGKLENRVNVDTTLHMYVQHLREHYGADVPKERLLQLHGDVIGALATAPDKYFWRIPLRRTVQELEEAQRHLWTVALEMTKASPDLYPHGGFHCTFCRFKEPCQQVNMGGDPLIYMEQLYRPKSSYYGDPIIDVESISGG